MKFAYYPGCSLEGSSLEFNESVLAVAKTLGIELVELPDWNCCGASSAHHVDKFLSIALPARNMAIAGELGLDMAVACAACFSREKHARHELRADPELKSRVEEIIGKKLNLDHQVRHMLDVVVRELGIERVREKVARPLKGLKVACYYGCYLVRPPAVMEFDDPENPRIMDDLMRALGADVRDWSSKIDCCGGSLVLYRIDIAEKLVGGIVKDARESGADAIVCACPLCQSNLDIRQRPGEGEERMPVFFFTELMGLAMGLPDVRSWLKKHITSPLKYLESVGLVS
ncbi:MAG: CoB--CoM heterodisulfide reductase iron-sulfur subunit B family protein [Planctomycetota bacterium]|nr:CoB--CoM heterodisulfide reductase iron-sulfur subunit B family protein [Planctomycetota bacterium]